MSSRLPLLATLVLVATAVPAAGQLPCVNPAADPCVIDSGATIPIGVYDIRPKSLVVGNKLITVSGTGGMGELEILANDITFQPGARFVANAATGTITISLEATGAIDLQSQGTSKSRIEVSGNFDAGSINLVSGGNLTSNATLLANASNLFGFAGTINLLSMTGDVSIGVDGIIRASGGAQGGGGAIAVDAIGGSISVMSLLEAKNGDCSGCDVSLGAEENITTTTQGVVDMQASGIGDGGTFNAIAGGNIALAGQVLANGSSDDFEGGAGGEIDIDGSGSVIVAGRIEADGAGQAASPGSETGSVDGDGGTVSFASGTTLQVNAPVTANSKGFGSGDGISIDALGNVTIAADMTSSGDEFAGDVSIISDTLVTVSARIRASSIVDPVNNPGALGGSIDIQACQITVTAGGELIATGPGGNGAGSNFLWASTGLSVAGKLTATDRNELLWRTSAPVITGTVIPAASIAQNMLLPCCGVQCPATTTSTSSSTSTTSTSTSSTSTSSTSSPSTSSTTAPGATTSSSTSTVAPTTTSSPSSTAVPTTSTTSTTNPAASSTSTVPASTSTTSTAPGGTTSTTSTIPGGTTSTTSTLPGGTTSTTTTAPTTSSTTTAATSSSTSSTVAGGTSTSSSTTLATTSTTVSSTSTLAPTTSTTSVTPSTTSTTTVPLTCLDTALGIEAVRCRLGFMSELVTTATETELGGRKLARRIAKYVAKATTLAGEPLKTKRLKGAAKQLKQLSKKVAKGVTDGKVDATIGADLQALAGEAQSELTALTTP